MAENISIVADRMVGVLGSAVLQKCLKDWKVEKKFEELQRRISELRTLLSDAELWKEGEQVKKHLESLENAVYETDKFLDSCLVVALGRARLMSTRNKLQKYMSDPIVSRLKMVFGVKKAMESLAKATSPFNKSADVGGKRSTTENASVEGEDPYPEQSVEDIIGRDFDIWKVKQLALEYHASTSNNQELRVIPIVGVKGMGKTTLAKFIYNEPGVMKHLNLRMWVCISDLPDLRSVIQKLITEAAEDRHETASDNLRIDQLQVRLREIINGKRFLLVLDDMRDKDQQLWLSLRNLLIGVARGSTVLVTTRSKKVGKLTGTIAQSYELGPLDDDEPWLLFQREASHVQHREEEEEGEEFGDGSAFRVQHREQEEFEDRSAFHVQHREEDEFEDRSAFHVQHREEDEFEDRSAFLVQHREEKEEEEDENEEEEEEEVEEEFEDRWKGSVREIVEMCKGKEEEVEEEFEDRWKGSVREIVEMCKGIPLVLLLAGKKLSPSPTNQWKKLFLEDKSLASLTQFEVPYEEEVVGRESDKGAILKLLLEASNSKDELVIISICGVAGIGKTALAQLIFDDPQIEDHFDLRIWVSVSEDFDLKLIMEKILASMTTTTTKPGGNLRTDELEHYFHQEIDGKRYLLVLDDVRDHVNASWLDFIGRLAVRARGSRVVVTAKKFVNTPSIAGCKHHTDELEPLKDDGAWSLFRKVAFEEGQEPTTSEKIVSLQKKILSKCRGIPYSIIAIGGILKSKDVETEWQTFCDEKLPEMIDEEGMLRQPLKLIYDHLPYNLKPCFAYCALLPNDYEIDVQKLVNWWISQGFVSAASDLNLEDVGYDYFEELRLRSIFEKPMRDVLGRITKCKMEKSMCEFARKEALNACATLGLKGEINGTNTRHVSFDFHLDSSWQIRKLSPSKRTIQTLILPRQSPWEVEGRSSEAVCHEVTKYKRLRMLDLHNSGIKIVSDSIGDLKHLRYLDLSQNLNIRALPKSIGKLGNLQTLKLNHCINLQKLPKTIKNLVNLRNLENESCYSLTHIPQGLSQLTNLRTLSEFVLCKDKGKGKGSVSSLGELEKINLLRGELKIKNLTRLGDNEKASAVLKEKKHLVSVVLLWETDAAIEVVDYEKLLEDLEPNTYLSELSLCAYGGIKFPSWLPLHANLVKFSLSRCMKCPCLQPLYRLSNLQVLLVDELPELVYFFDSSLEEQDKNSGAFFKSLKELQLTNLPKLIQWWKDEVSGVPEEDIFPRLSKLIIEDCPNLTSMPLFPCLEVLVMKTTTWTPFQKTLAKSDAVPLVPALSKLKTLCIINMSNGDSDMFLSLKSLCYLTFDNLQDMEPFLEGLVRVNEQQITNLQELYIWRCATLKDISWIGKIRSLRKLSLRLCANLTIPPEKISLIHSIPKVEIAECPHLSHIQRMLDDRLYSSSDPRNMNL